MPFSWWHRRAMVILGSAHFFDAFDAAAMAFVLPVLVGLWHLSPNRIGLLISVGSCGQMAGAILLGGLAERFGRISILQWALGLLAGLSLACALTSGYGMLLALRFVQGIGLGAEVPIAATYVNEVTPARFRGRTVGIFQFMFGIGAVAAPAASLLLIPHFGWRSVFIVGTAPLILAVLLRRILPESPRWLVARGRISEAEASVAVMEGAVYSGYSVTPSDMIDQIEIQAAPRRSDWRALLTPPLLSLTLSVWLIAFCVSLIFYGIINWMPTIYTTIYGLPLETALYFSFIMGACSLIAALAASFLIDRIGRKGSFLLGFAGAFAAMLVMTLTVRNAPPLQVMLLASLCMSFIGISMVTIYVYGPEIYPVLLRAFATGVASAWIRVGSILGPIVIGFLLTNGGGIRSVFILFTAVAGLGAVSVLLLAVETKGIVLDAPETGGQ